MSAGGPTIGLLSLALPHSSRADELAILLTVLGGYAVAGVMLLGAQKLPTWAFGLAVSADVVLGVGEPTVSRLSWWFSLMAGIVLIGLLVAVLKERVEELVARLAEAAGTDPLTALTNRRAFELSFEAELARARRAGEPLGVVVGDADHFKALNDRHGHDVGDAALERIAETLRRVKRPPDTAARLGGKELALLVPGADTAEAQAMAERVRRALESDGDAHGPAVRISFGVACFPAHGADRTTLLKAADRARYAAKDRGRNRVCTPASSAVDASPGPADGLVGGRGAGLGRGLSIG